MKLMKRIIISLCAIFAIAMMMYVGFYFGMKSVDNPSISDEITYKNNNEGNKIRYKYITNYEALDDSKLNVKSEPVYSLFVNDELVSETFTGHEHNIPNVSETHNLKKNETISFPFHIELHEDVEQEEIRVDVKVIIEELRSGKWTPVYQVVFMERGPYWSLDKGPIEFEKGNVEE